MVLDYFKKTWLEEYVEDLTQFKDDLDLKIDGYDIFLSIDFYDILNFSFPFSLHSRFNAKWDNEDYLKYYYNYQISRITMFFMLEKFYKKPNILLPSYVTECDDFIDYMDIQVDRYIFEGLKKIQENPSIEIGEIIKECKESGNYDKLIVYINDNYPQLIYYYNRGYASGLEVFNNLLTKYFTDDISILLTDEIGIKNDLNFILINYVPKLIDRERIEILVQAARRNKERRFQNKRDAEAIYLTLCLNEIYNSHKKAFCLFSSANNLKGVMSIPIWNVNKTSISGKEFKILRDSRFFLDIMFEINSYINYKLDKMNIRDLDKMRIEEIDFRDLSLAITKTLSKLNFYNSYLFGAGGRLTEIIQNEARREINLDNTIEKMERNLAILLDEYIGIGENLKRYVDLDKEIALSIIQAYGKKEPLSYGLFMRRLEAEKSNLQDAITRLTSSPRNNLYVVTFSLPFKLYLDNDKAIEIINGIVASSSQGRIEYSQRKGISDTTSDKIYSELIRLINLSEDEEYDSRLLLMQFCFLYIGRYDLVDHIYDLFNRHVSEPLKREMSYIYLVSFIRKFRAIKIGDANYFMNMAKLCESYIYSSEKTLSKNINCYDIICNENNCILRDKDNREILVIKSPEVNPDMKVNSIDIRFFHLQTTIINRFILDFELLDQKLIQNMIETYDYIFIPIVQSFEEDYKIAILGSYAYLLSLYAETPDYKSNLENALKIMAELRESVDKNSPRLEPYWGYVRNFQCGYIHYKYSLKCGYDDKLNYLQKAKDFYERSSQQLPILAENLHDLLDSKIALCDVQIKVLNESKR